ncbi:MAG: DUF502 domain-containing protein [Nitrospinae bacterium]|nr:DUF502 domain-containing protein [Nitrospinota bacterium]
MITKIKTKAKTIFLAGLLFIVPGGFTVFVLSFLFKSLDQLFTPVLEKLFISLGHSEYIGYHIPGLGFILALFSIFLVGLITKNFIGKRLVAVGEKIVEKIPFVNSLYNGAKQVIEAVASSQAGAFRKVVLLEFPRKGLYCLGLVTCENTGEIQERTGGNNIINVFIPTTPNPTSGYLLFVPEDELTYLDMSVEDGIKMIISGGILSPNRSSLGKAR